MSLRCQMMSKQRQDGKPGRCRCLVNTGGAGTVLMPMKGKVSVVCCGNHRRALWHGKEVLDWKGNTWSQLNRNHEDYICRPPHNPAHMQLTDPDGQPVEIDADDIIHIEDRIKYTTLIVREGRFTKRVVVTDTPDQVRILRTAARKER